jgi:hypothetical protein
MEGVVGSPVTGPDGGDLGEIVVGSPVTGPGGGDVADTATTLATAASKPISMG